MFEMLHQKKRPQIKSALQTKKKTYITHHVRKYLLFELNIMLLL